MITRATNSERGQVLVLIILSLTALLGFAALAIDGGMIYSERRVAQNAADAAAYAGAASFGQQTKNFNPGELKCVDFNNATHAWNSSSKKPHYAAQAVARAADNTFVITYKTDPASVTKSDNAVWMVCGDDSELALAFVDVHVRITRQVSTSLMHLFYNGPAINTVDSVVRVYPPAGVATGAAIVSLCSHDASVDHDNPEGLYFQGGAEVTITEGKAISNCDVDFGGSPDDITIPKGVTYHRYVDETKLPPPAQTPVEPGDFYNFPYSFGNTLKALCNASYPDEDATDDITVPAHDADNIAYFSGGKYDDINLVNGSVKLEPGLYCIYGDVDVRSSDAGIVVGSESYSFYAKDVTFYIDSGAEKFIINGRATSYLTAPDLECFDPDAPCVVDYLGNPIKGEPIKGLLIWYAPDETVDSNNIVQLVGNGNSVFAGTITAPLSDVHLGGTGATETQEFSVQVIADDVTIIGDATLNIHHDPSKIFSTQTQMGLER